MTIKIKTTFISIFCTFIRNYQAISALECEHIKQIHIFLRMHIITSLCECVRVCWICMNMLNEKDFIGMSNVVIHIHIFLHMRIITSLRECVRIYWICMNMLNEKDFIGMCNDVTSRSIIQNKSYRLTLFKGVEHLWGSGFFFFSIVYYRLCFCLVFVQLFFVVFFFVFFFDFFSFFYFKKERKRLLRWIKDAMIVSFLKAITHFCNFIPSNFMEGFAFLIDDTSYRSWTGFIYFSRLEARKLDYKVQAPAQI